MRHILTMLIAFHWMAVFAMLAIVSTVDPEHGMLAALRFLGAVPLPDASDLGGGPLAAAFLAVAFAVASVLFLWTLLTDRLGDGMFGSETEAVARRAFGCGIGVLSLLLIGGACCRCPGLFVTSAVALAALLASYLAVYAERWAVSSLSAPDRCRSARRGSRHGGRCGAQRDADAGFPAGPTQQPARRADEVPLRRSGPRRWCCSGAGSSCRSTT